MSLIHVLRSLALAAAGLLLCAGGASANPLTPDDVARLVGDGKLAANISEPRVSPDGRHVSFLHDAHLRYDNPPPYDVPAPPCSDVWVARVDGSQLTRLTKTCEHRGTYETRGGGGTWGSDGAVLTWYSDYVKGSSSSTRWKVTADSEGLDRWTPRSYSGDQRISTPDGRYLIYSYWEAVAVETYSAVDVATGVEHPVWVRVNPGRENWSASCSSAAPPAYGGTPSLEEISAALSGPEPACTFAAVPKAAEPTVVTPELVELSGRLEVPSSVAITSAADSATAPVPLGSAPQVVAGPSLRLLAVTSSLRRAKTHGFRLSYVAPGAVSVRAWVLRSDREKGTVIARGSAPTGSGQLQLRGTALLRQLRLTAKLTVRLAATDAQGRRSVLDQPLTLRP